MAFAKIISLCLATLSLVVLVVAHGSSSSFESPSSYAVEQSYVVPTHHHQCQLEYVSDYDLLRELELRRQSYLLLGSSSYGHQGYSSSSGLEELSLEELLISSGKGGGVRGGQHSTSHGTSSQVPLKFHGGQGGFRGRGPSGAVGAGSVGSVGAVGAIGTIQGERERGSFHKSGVGASHTAGAFKDISGHNRENIRTDNKGFGHETIKDVNIDQGFRDREGFIEQDKIGAGQSSGEFERQSGKASGAIGAIGAQGAKGVGAVGTL